MEYISVGSRTSISIRSASRAVVDDVQPALVLSLRPLLFVVPVILLSPLQRLFHNSSPRPEDLCIRMWHIGTMPVVDECHDLVVNAILWTALAFVAVCLRLFTRGFIVKRTGWDDYLMAAAMVSCSSHFSLLGPFQFAFNIHHGYHDLSAAFFCRTTSGLEADRVTRFAPWAFSWLSCIVCHTFSITFSPPVETQDLRC